MQKITEDTNRARKRVRRSATPDQIVLSVPQAAARLGWTERAAWLAIYRKKIPSRRLGKKVFVLVDELEAFLKNLPGVSLKEAQATVEEASK